MKWSNINLNNLKQVLNSNKCLLCLLIIFAILYTFNLDKYPAVWTDEAWFINPAYNLAFHGFLGTTMMPNFYNIAHYTYWQMPFYMILLAISFKLFGFGIIQARMVSVTLGFFTVLFTYLLGKELYNHKIGLVSAALLIFNPLFFLVAREARMDIAVACFTVIALYLLVKSSKNGKYSYYFGVGFFAMLSVLSHPNGVFSVICIALIYGLYNFKNFRFNFKLKEITSMILGSIPLVIPYLYYISLDFPDFIGQFKSNILNSSGPLNNIISESIRYSSTFNFFIIIDKWSSIIAIIVLVYLALIGLIYLIKNRTKFNVKFLIIALIVPLILLTVLVDRKASIWYFAAILPYLSILMTLSIKGIINYKKNIQRTVPLLICLFIVINAFGIVNILYATNNSSSKIVYYDAEKYIPNGSVIVGDPTYWISLHSNYTYYDHHYLDNSTFKNVKINYILYDSNWANNQSFPGINKFLNNNCTLIGEITINSSINLSPIKIYKIKKN